jgi:hypothetical protein
MCTSLTSIDLPNVTSISGNYTFAHCEYLTSVYLPNLTSVSGKDIFDDCTTENIDITLNAGQYNNVSGTTWSVPGQSDVYTFKSITFVPDYEYIEDGDED